RRRVTRRSSRRRRKSIQIRLSEHVSREIWAIFFLGFTVINFLSLQGNAGGFGEIWNHSVITPVFGALAYVVPAFSLLISLTLFFSKKISFELGRVLGIAMLCISVLGIVQLSAPIESMFEMAPQYGGYVGFTSNFILYLLFGSTGAAIVLVGTALVSLLMVFNISFSELFGFFKDAVTGDEKEEKSGKFSTKVKSASADTEIEEFELNIVRADQENEKNNNKAKRIVPISESENIKPATESAPASAEDESSLNSRSEDYSNYRFPELSFLSNDAKNKDYGDDLLVQNAEIIRRKLEQFSIRVTMKDAHVGPTVIQYTLKPAEDVKISKITSLKNDLALALSAQAIRIEAPIPGKGLVGIEIPAHHRAIVQIGGIIKSATFQNHTGYLSLVLGRDVSGLPMVADLTEMPHLLVAGQTGSGKSIGINSFLISLLYQHSPETLRMILIDPKRVELTNYNGLPHLLTPVITEPDKALQSLKWAVSEMNRRYKELARHGKRNIEEYNKTFPHNRMPFIVLVIDELADLMMAASKEIEATICRLAQMARATGIHLIIATQRPSVDVITGLIKANIPTRVA
ncbi:MAG: DNA translocase FtsK 4TM domain-containing protein, partial [Candidatus Gracilibacteria bacterium]|nr:DNA translocase FtsK 4TM domain-containing protein [Candidatus Gracilibacteria bacterium]